MFALSDLIKPQTRAAFLQACIDVCASLGLNVTAWQSGGWTNTILTLIAQTGANASQTIVEPIKGGFGDLLSSDEWADQWAKGGYDLDRVPARPATTDTFRAVNSSLTNYTLQPSEGIFANAVTGKRFRNRDLVTIAASATTEPIAIFSEEVGTGSNSSENSITDIVAPGLTGVEVTNPDAALGADAELTPAMIRRARKKWGSLSPLGPKSAYDYVALTPFLPDGTPLSNTGTPITRAKTVSAPPNVTEYIATATGAPSGPDVAIVDGAIKSWAEPWTANASAVASPEHVLAVTYEVWLSSNLSTPQIEALIAVGLATYFSSIDIGGDVIPPAAGMVYVEGLEFAIAAAVPGVKRVVITLPATDTVMGATEVPKLGAITATVHRI